MDYYSDLTFVAAAHHPNCDQRNNAQFTEFYNLQFILNGQIYFGIDGGKCVTLSEPTIYWHHPRHSYQYGLLGTLGWNHFWVTFRGPRAARIIEQGFMPLSKDGYSPIFQAAQMREEFSRLIHLIRGGKNDDHPRAVALLESILARAWEDNASQSQHREPHYKAIAEAAHDLQQNVETEPDWEVISHQAGMSYSSFRRLFRKLEKSSPHHYFLRCRMQRAVELLRDTELSVKEIAYQFGYDDIAQFSKLFKQKIGTSPSQFRKKTA